MVRLAGGASVTVTVPLVGAFADVRHPDGERDRLPRHDDAPGLTLRKREVGS